MSVLSLFLIVCYTYTVYGGGCKVNSKGTRLNNAIYACRGEFTGGIESSSAQGVCDSDYQICSRSEVNTYITYDTCANLPTGNNQFFAAKESSNGNNICNNDENDGSDGQGTNGICFTLYLLC